MLNFARNEVKSAPFPHVVSEQVLDATLFAELKADFPANELFEDQHAKTGSTGSRVGAGTGFDIYRGDDQYDRLIGSSSAWSKLDAYINSPAFVETFLELFGPQLDAAGCALDVRPERYDREFVEGRDVLTETVPLGERFRKLLWSFGVNRVPDPELFTRLDIERSVKGYAKPPHCDRSNRLASLIIYFTNQDEVGLRGGDLNIYRHKREKRVEDYERHPRPDDVECVTVLPVRENLGVFFPCSNNSYHGVNAVTTPGIARDFLYINISANAPSCWR